MIMNAVDLFEQNLIFCGRFWKFELDNIYLETFEIYLIQI